MTSHNWGPALWIIAEGKETARAQKYDFATEKRDALQAWADHVEAMIAGKTEEKVVQMSARR